MMTRRTVAVIVLIVVGTLQLWDSRVFSGGAPAIAMASTGLALPVVALLTTDRMGLRIGSIAGCAILLLAAKAFAPHPLPAIGIVAAIAAAANWLVEVKEIG